MNQPDLDALERAAKEIKLAVALFGDGDRMLGQVQASILDHAEILAREAETLRGRVGELEAVIEEKLGGME